MRSSQVEPVALVSAMLLACVGAASCVRHVPDTVTCQGLRSLQLGMSEQGVLERIGPPLDRVNGPDIQRDASTERWIYSSDGLLGGLSVYVDLHDKRLSKVSAGTKYVWDASSSIVYVLAPEGRRESRSFNKFFRCVGH
jgi:hypothetical protein